MIPSYDLANALRSAGERPKFPCPYCKEPIPPTVPAGCCPECGRNLMVPRPANPPTSFKFASRFTVLDRELPEATEAEIKSEPMLFRCDLTHAMDLGGPLTHAFVRALPFDWICEDLLIDSRVHMLMTGWYPCIPGWHHDDIPREREDGQPNYVNPSYLSEHLLALWGDASLTEFAVGVSEFPDVPLGKVFYREWHPLVQQQIEAGVLRREVIPQRRLVQFDWQGWHQGTPATKNGWRFFIRATRFSRAKAANETRANAQVYMPALHDGW